MAKKIVKKSELQTIVEQNRKMRELLREWPARRIMMDYEKAWNEKRERFLAEPSLDLEL